MSNDKITAPDSLAVDIHSIALGAARKIAAIDPSKMPGGAIQALAAIQVAVREAIELYGLPHEQELIRRSLADVVDPNDLAEAFCKFVPSAVLGKVDQGILASWFGDAIIKGFDIASKRSVKRLTMIYECERILGDPKASDKMKSQASHTKDALLDRQDHGLALVDRRELDEAKAKIDELMMALDFRAKQVTDYREELAAMEQRKDAAYLERNQVVAALAKCFPSAVTKTAIEGWSEDWHGVVYIQLPTGQASWHFHDSQEHLFDGIPRASWVWDGHTTPEKYDRLALIQIGDASAGWAWPLPVPEIELTPEQRATLSTASANLEGVDIDAAHNGIRSMMMDPEEVKAFIRAGDHIMTETRSVGISSAVRFREPANIHHASIDVLTEMGALSGPSDASALMTAHLKTAGLLSTARTKQEWIDTMQQAAREAKDGDVLVYGATKNLVVRKDEAGKVRSVAWEESKDVDNSVDSVDNAPKGEQAQESGKEQTKGESDTSEQAMQEKQERKGVFIPGAKWPVPGERRFTLDRRDPMNPANRADPIERSAKDRRKGGKRDS